MLTYSVMFKKPGVGKTVVVRVQAASLMDAYRKDRCPADYLPYGVWADPIEMKPTAEGIKYLDPYQESWVKWAVFPASLSDAEVLAILGHPAASYQGPGRPFRDAPFLRRSRSRVLVKQFGGLDV